MIFNPKTAPIGLSLCLALAVAPLSLASVTPEMDKRLAEKGFSRVAQVDRVRNFRVHGWNYLDRRAVTFNVGASSHYLVTTRNSCTSIRSASTIGFTTTITNVTDKDALLVRDRDGSVLRCPIDEIHVLERIPEPH